MQKEKRLNLEEGFIKERFVQDRTEIKREQPAILCPSADVCGFDVKLPGYEYQSFQSLSVEEVLEKNQERRESKMNYTKEQEQAIFLERKISWYLLEQERERQEFL